MFLFRFLYDEEFNLELYREAGIATLEPLKFTNLKDADAVEVIYKTVLEHLNKDKFFVTIGGEHTVAIGAIKAYSEIYPNLTKKFYGKLWLKCYRLCHG